MTTTLTEAKTYTEWAVELTWPDGHVEVKRRDGRAEAEYSARMRNDLFENGVTAKVVTRTVTVTEWAAQR